MGDMNAGCANVRISDWDTMELWRREEFTWLITHDYDTTLSINCCPYDRYLKYMFPKKLLRVLDNL